MLKTICMLTLLIAMVLMGSGNSRAQREGFIAVEGTSLRSKMNLAVRQGRARQTRFWTAYSFDVRPGVAVDVEFNNGNGNGSTTIVSGTSISVGSHIETRNLGVFALHEPADGSIVRIEVYNLDRRREYSSYPVYWLGRAGNDESLSLLKGFVESNQICEAPKRSIVAIALHDDPRVGGMLEDFVRHSNVESVRSSAVFWLGQTPGHNPFLAELVRNEQESVKVRKQGAFAIGGSKEQGAIAA